MSHPNDLLTSYLDGELVASDREAIADHLYECPTCRRELEGLTEVRSLVRGLPLLDPPVPLMPSLRRTPRWATAAASVAAAALAIGLVVTPASAPTLDLDDMAGQHNARVVVDPGISTIRGSLVGP